MLCWIRCPQAIADTHCCPITLRLESWITVIHNLSSFISGREGNDGAIHGRQGTGTASCREGRYYTCDGEGEGTAREGIIGTSTCSWEGEETAREGITLTSTCDGREGCRRESVYSKIFSHVAISTTSPSTHLYG